MNISKPFLILLSVISINSYAASTDEINHLLSYVESTECKYERNGTMHTGAEAAEHINKKYEYYQDDIKTTEDFIKYSATKSKMSGKYYKIHCAEKTAVKSKDWLLSELKRYRLAQK